MTINNNISIQTQPISQEVCDKLEKVIETLKNVHEELYDTINDVYHFCISHTKNENFNHSMYVNSLYNPDKHLERLLGDPIYSNGLDQYCCAIVYESLSSEVHTTAVSMFIPSTWVDNSDSCKSLIISELCNSMITHLGYCNEVLAPYDCELEKLYERLNEIIFASGNVENFYNIKAINTIIAAYNSTFEKTDTETEMSIYTIADTLDNIYSLGSVFVREIYKINPRSQYMVIQENEYIHIKGLKGKNWYGSDLDEYIELIVPSDMYNKSEDDMQKYFTKYILTQIDNQVYKYKKNMCSFLEKHKHYDRDFSHIMRSLEL